MSTVIWRGDAAAVAQVDTVTVGGTIEADDEFLLTIGNKTLTVIPGVTAAADVADAIVAVWNALTQDEAPEFYEITALATSGGAFTLTAKTAGKPFVCTVETTESGGGAADSQTFSLSHTTSSSGPNDASTAANYSGGALPSNGDTLVFQNSNKSVLYGLDALSAVTLAKLVIHQSYTGYIGLPRSNGSSLSTYLEYRDQYLEVGATLWSIGLGDGSGTGRIKIDFGSTQFTGTIYNAGSQAENYVPAVLLLGTHASNALTVLKGTVGVAFFEGESSALDTLTIGYVSSVQADSIVQCGSGVTLGDVTKTGGQLVAESNIGTFVQYDGTTTINGSATITTATIGGTLLDRSSGTFTTVTINNKGVYDHSRCLDAKTITTLSVYAGASYKDPYDVVTLTNGLAMVACAPKDIELDIPIGKTLTIS